MQIRVNPFGKLYNFGWYRKKGEIHMKRISLFAVVSILAIILAACGANEKADSPKSEKNEETTNVEESTDVAETPTEPEIPQEAINAEGFKADLKALTEDQLELSQESYDFIVANNSLFPAKTKETIAEVKKKVDSSINAKQLNKNPQPYFKKIASFQGSVVTIQETPLDNGETVSVFHVLDDNMNSYQVLMYKTTGDILEEDVVRFWGAPVGASSFENVSGGTTNVQNFFGSHVEKVK